MDNYSIFLMLGFEDCVLQKNFREIFFFMIFFWKMSYQKVILAKPWEKYFPMFSHNTETVENISSMVSRGLLFGMTFYKNKSWKKIFRENFFAKSNLPNQAFKILNDYSFWHTLSDWPKFCTQSRPIEVQLWWMSCGNKQFFPTHCMP